MRILAFTDIHSQLKYVKRIAKKAPQSDLLICAGDFTIFGDGMKKTLRALDKIGKKILLIHGNHEDVALVRKEIKKFKNIIFIHKKVHYEGDFAVIGYGGGGFSKIDTGFEKFAVKVKIKKGKQMILVTHAPPYRTKLDMLWEHRGNKSIKDFIRKKKPVLAICGHFHENEGKKQKIGKSLLVNPGHNGMIIDLTSSFSS